MSAHARCARARTSDGVNERALYTKRAIETVATVATAIAADEYHAHQWRLYSHYDCKKNRRRCAMQCQRLWSILYLYYDRLYTIKSALSLGASVCTIRGRVLNRYINANTAQQTKKNSKENKKKIRTRNCICKYRILVHKFNGCKVQPHTHNIGRERKKTPRIELNAFYARTHESRLIKDDQL